MRITVLFLSLIFAGLCWGDSLITNPGYALGNGDASVDGYSTKWSNYDIESLDLSANSTQVVLTLLFNYGVSSSNPTAWTNLSSFKDKNDSTYTPLNVGDLFLYDPAGDSFGISLSGADGETKGTIYSLSANGTKTASQVVGGVAGRPTTAVWIDPSKSPTADGAGSVSIDQTLQGAAPSGYSASAVKVTITFQDTALNSAALKLFDSANVGFQFESTTCANGIFTGAFQTYGNDSKTPEPSTLAMAFGGLLLAGIGLIRRKRSV